MSESKKYYILSRIHSWESLGIQMFGVEGTEGMAKLRGPNGSPGILVVFESLEALLATHPHVHPSQVLVLQATNGQ